MITNKIIVYKYGRGLGRKELVYDKCPCMGESGVDT